MEAAIQNPTKLTFYGRRQMLRCNLKIYPGGIYTIHTTFDRTDITTAVKSTKPSLLVSQIFTTSAIP